MKTWKSRLQQAVDKSGKSYREISLQAQRGPGYLHSILKTDKEPTVSALIDICRALDVSCAYVIEGVSLDPESIEIVRVIDSRPNIKDGILQILRA
jgi:hypothetical protein